MRQSIRIGAAILWASSVAAQGPSPEEQRQLVEQKIRLLEMLLKSPVAKASSAGHGAEPQSLAARGRRAIDRARIAMADDRLDEAQQVLDDALKSSSAESRRLHSEEALTEGAQRQAYRNLSEQVAAYRASVAELTKDAKIEAAARSLLLRIDAQVTEAGKREAAGRLAEANRLLGNAYEMAVTEISRWRAGQEVVMSLHFDTPADEYAYELKRFESGEIMVGMMVAEGNGAGDRQALVDAAVAEGRQLRDEAARLAENGRHREAIGLMEQATDRINRALQTMGVPVF